VSTSPIPLNPVGSIDDLLDRARRGAAAGHALDVVKDKLTALRDELYYKFLNAPDDKAAEFKHSLKAIERLSRALLLDEAQGELAYRTLLEMQGINAPEPEVPLRATRVARKRPARARRQAAQ